MNAQYHNNYGAQAKIHQQLSNGLLQYKFQRFSSSVFNFGIFELLSATLLSLPKLFYFIFKSGSHLSIYSPILSLAAIFIKPQLYLFKLPYSPCSCAILKNTAICRRMFACDLPEIIPNLNLILMCSFRIGILMILLPG